MKIIISLLLTFFILGQSIATERNVLLAINSYSVPEGLTQTTVTSLVEDAEGFIWVGTLNGLNRFDGEEFEHYLSSNSVNSLPSSFIRSLLITSNQTLLIGTDKGLVTYNRKTNDFIYEDNFKGLPIWSMSQDGKEIFIGTENAIFTVNENLEISSTIKGELSGVKEIVKQNKTFFIRNYFGNILKLNINKKQETILSDARGLIKNNNILYSYNNDGLFIISEQNVIKISSDIYDSITTYESNLLALSGYNIYTVNINGSDHLIGTLNIKGKNLTKPEIKTGKENTYITTQNVGFIKESERKNIISKLNLTNSNVWSIKQDEHSNLYVATDSNYITQHDIYNKEITRYDSETTGPKQILISNDSIFIATDNGLSMIDTATKVKTSISNDQFFAIGESTNKSLLYAGTTTGKLLIINTKTLQIEAKVIDKGNPIFDIKESNGTVWVATQGGLFSLEKNKIKNIYNKEIVISLHIKNNLIYFGTESSLLSYNLDSKEIFKIYSNNKPIYSITSIDNNIYASSIKEVSVTDINSNKTIKLSEDHGSQAEYNAQSMINIDGTILIGGISGISSISQNKLNNHLSKQTETNVNLKQLLIFNTPEEIGGAILKERLSSTNKIELKYSDYPFTFTFNSPQSNYPNTEYVYQMNGLSDTWIESKGTNSATYTNLSPGDYVFKVYAVDPLTLRHGPIKSIGIEITPPWWLSKQAKLVYFIITLIISAVIVQAILRRREVQKQIAKSEERLKLSLWGSGDEMWDWDIETGQIYRSNIWGSLEFPRDGQRSGESGEESNIHPMDQERVSTALNNHFDSKTDHFEAAYRVKGKSDEWVWILDRAKIVERDEKDNPLRMTGTIKNINNFKNAEEQLRLFERAIANISEGMFILDHNFIFVEVNEACCDLSLIPKEQFIGSLFKFNLYPDSYSEQIRSILHQQGSWSNDVESAKGDGTSFLMELTVDAIYDEQGQLSHYVGVFSDISRRKLQEEELRKLTNNDLLTNLPNRSSLMVTLGNLVKRDTHHTLMVLDLDNFKKINDSMGHQVGDELLIKVAKRIEATVPYHTSIYRLGGDEFAILVDNNPDIGSSAVIANNVIDAFVSPFEITSEKVVVGLSIGIVLYPEDDQNEQALLRKADIAMYHAKSGGGNRYQFYSESINRNAIRQLEVENLIREGLRDDLFEVYYQPKIALKTGRMAGMEALVRLNHPVHGLIPPSEFIPLAEENGLIVDIGDLVMRKACFATQKWRSQGLFNGRVAVNLSSYQFALPDLQQRIESILRLTQLPAENLELEITEGTVIKQPEKAIKVMQQLSKMGVSLALDDFGTGYSSLSYLKRFPIHTLKIDKAFVDDIDKSDRDLKMVDSIITIAHNMGLSVVGEGVEDASQLSILKALNCEEIQGFIFSKAVTESEFSKLLLLDFIEPDIVQKNIKAT